MTARGLIAQDAVNMADIHSHAFDRGWPALDMSVHIKTDLCFGIGEPLTAFIILRVNGNEAEILTLATDMAARRKGYGRNLLKAATAHLTARDVGTLFLEVAEDNEAALALYKSFGFSPVGRRPAYYRRANGRVSAITFSMSLPPNS
ncbi:MAG: GNAT family N-acetyltransferase [Litorimonas sp.]